MLLRIVHLIKQELKHGDIILEFNGYKINEMKELPAIVAQTKVGKQLKLKFGEIKKKLQKKLN